MFYLRPTIYSRNVLLRKKSFSIAFLRDLNIAQLNPVDYYTFIKYYLYVFCNSLEVCIINISQNLLDFLVMRHNVRFFAPTFFLRHPVSFSGAKEGDAD
jgi:hypothetical protein